MNGIQWTGGWLGTDTAVQLSMSYLYSTMIALIYMSTLLSSHSIISGVHGCSNSAFDKPWPKASHVKTKLNEVVSSTSEETEVIQKLFDVFHNDQRYLHCHIFALMTVLCIHISLLTYFFQTKFAMCLRFQHLKWAGLWLPYPWYVFEGTFKS